MLDRKQVEQLLFAIQSFTYFDPVGRPIGIDGRIRINYFLDMLSACHDDKICDQLANILAKNIVTELKENNIDGLIVPKRGNVLLARAVAKRLRVRSAAVRESILFNRWVEGEVGASSRALLIDDIASDGEVLRDAADNARKAGVFVQQVIVLIDRTEGDAAEMFRLDGLSYSYLCQLSDADIQETLKRRAS